MPPPLTAEEQERIRAAVAEAERGTSGEIVPYVVSRSEAYADTVWRGAVAGGALAMLTLLIVLQLHVGWGLAWAYTAWGMALVTSLGAALGALLPGSLPAVRRALAGQARMALAVHRRAEVAFVEEEVFATRDRSGILLFVSLFEHRIEVLADAGIHEKVDAAVWAELVVAMRDAIRQGRMVDGLVQAVERCGAILAEHGMAPVDGTNELANEVRLRRE